MVNGRWVTASEARRLRGLDLRGLETKKVEVPQEQPKTPEIKKEEEPKEEPKKVSNIPDDVLLSVMTYTDLFALLRALGGAHRRMKRDDVIKFIQSKR